MEGQSLFIQVFLLQLVNVAFGFTGEFLWLEFGSSDVVLGVVELLVNCVYGTGKTWLSLYGKNDS